jgi:hypothetical protein
VRLPGTLFAVLFLALVMTVPSTAGEPQFSFRKINSYTFDIFGPAADFDGQKWFSLADRLCAPNGWHSSKPIEYFDNNRKFRFRVECLAR